MTCADYTERLSVLLDGELSPAEMAIVTNHVAACPNCPRHLAELAMLRAALQEEMPEEEAPEFHSRIFTLLAGQSIATHRRPGNVVALKQRNLREGLAWVAAAGAIAALLIVTMLPHRDETKDLMSVRDAALRGGFKQNIVDAQAPSVPGFRLAAARADVIAGHLAQVYSYDGSNTAITLCVWKANGEPAHGVREAIFKGMKIAYWNDGDHEYWAVTSGSGASLGAFAAAIGKS